MGSSSQPLKHKVGRECFRPSDFVELASLIVLLKCF
jgi:hypothetical protein